MGLTVVTYGGGEILNNIFNAIAMLMNGKNGGFLQPLMIITISIGTIWAVTKAFFTSSAQAFLLHFIIPLIAIVGVFMVPTASVHIEDILKNRPYNVDHVPFLLAKFAELTSSLGYYVTSGVEKAMHVPNDVAYNSTGMIFGADTAMDIKRYKIANADLENNLRTFCRQCVLYDLHLGRYSIDELKKTTDLWKFFEERTSKVNMMRYIPIVKKKEGRELGEYLSCQAAIKKMAPYFSNEKSYYGQLDVCKNLGLTFQAITGLQKNAEELIGQQLMMNLVSDEYSGNNFSKARAYIQQRNTYQVLGSLASSSLVTLRAVFEALIYAAFIFVIPLSVIPGGIRIVTTWAGLVVWIQLWPPFYAILNYIMQSVSHGYAQTVFQGLTDAQKGLSFFTSIGLDNLQQDIYALSGYFAASIPFITYAILKGGVSSFVHLAGSMMSPAHSASSAAAAEQTTGNYSFANSSFGQMSYKNTSSFQANMAPSLTGGFFYENTGTSSAIYSNDEQILKQSNSDLRTSLFSDDSISQTFQASKMHAQSAVDSAQKNYSEGLSMHARNMVDLSDHLANSESYSNGYSQREAHDLLESSRYFQNIAENFGSQHGLSSRESKELLAGVGIDFLGNGAKGTSIYGSSKDETVNSAYNLGKSEEFQKNFQKLQDVSSSDAYNSLSDSGKRLAESSSRSYEKMQSSNQAFQIAQTELNQVSENATWAAQNSHSVRRALNQDFVDWASNEYADEGGFLRVQEILNKGGPTEQDMLVRNFIEHVRCTSPNFSAPEMYREPQMVFSRELPNEVTIGKAEETMSTFLENSASHFSNPISSMKEDLTQKFAHSQNLHTQQFGQVASDVESARVEAMQNFRDESEQSLYSKPFRMASSDVIRHFNKLMPALAKMNVSMPQIPNPPVAGNFQMKEQPFWLQEETR